MRSTCLVGLLLFAITSSAFAQADLQVSSSASQTQGLQLDDEILVTTTVRNNGPVAAPAGTTAQVVGEGQEIFFFQLVGSETPGCAITFLDFSPPLFNYQWSLPALAVGQEYTCVARLRVGIVPEDNTAQLFGGVTLAGDPVAGNNSSPISFFFGSFNPSTVRHTIPTTTHWGLALLAITLALAGYATTRGRA